MGSSRVFSRKGSAQGKSGAKEGFEVSKSSGWAFLGKLVGSVVITGAVVYGGVRIYAAIPPKPLTDEEQAKLRAAGIVWASPDAPLPSGVEHMLLLSKES